MLLMEASDPGDEIPTAKQRPHYESMMVLAELVIIVMASVGGFIYYASVAIRAVVEVRRGWPSLSSLGRAATVVFALEASGVPTHAIPPGLAQALFITDRMREAGYLSGLDKAYVVLSLVGNIWFWLGFLWLFKRSFSRWAHGIWRESFDPDWPASAGRGWRIYLVMLRVVTKLRGGSVKSDRV